MGYMVKSVQPDSINILVIPNPIATTEYKMTASVKGNLVIDAKTGLLIRSALQLDAKSTPGSGGNFWVVKKDVCELVRIKN